METTRNELKIFNTGDELNVTNPRAKRRGEKTIEREESIVNYS